MSKLFLGIDTSNYTTSAALFGSVNFNGKKFLPVAEGQVGLRQSDAVFHHTKQLPELLEEAFSATQGKAVCAVGVSDRPRDIDGSYMPCFLTGVGTARALSAALGVPLYKFSHQQGHIAAALYSAKKLDLLEEKFIAFHLSGGTTEALLVTPGKYNIPNPHLIASSLDLKAGQAVDRVGVMLGLPFPAGKYLDELASKCDTKFKIKPSLKGADVSLSGVQNKCTQMLEKGLDKESIARYCLEYIIVSMEGCILKLKEEYGELPVVFSGGVSSNSIMRKIFTEKYGALFAEPQFSADNAFGIAVLASIMEDNILS